jgi:hypothetical protein
MYDVSDVLLLIEKRVPAMLCPSWGSLAGITNDGYSVADWYLFRVPGIMFRLMAKEPPPESVE